MTIVGSIGQTEPGIVAAGEVTVYGGFFSYDAVMPPAPVVITWTNVAGGNWSDESNWSPNTVPGPQQVAVINLPGTYAVTVDYEALCLALHLGGRGGVQSLNWSGGIFSGTMFIQTNAVLILSGSDIGLDGTIENRGRINWVGDALTLRFEDNATLINRFGGLVDIQGGGWFYSESTATRAILNAGTIRKRNSTGEIAVSSGIRFLNAGTLELQTGALFLNALETSNTVSVASEAVLGLSSGEFKFLPGNSFVGTGKCWISDGASISGRLNGGLTYVVTEGAHLNALLEGAMWWTNGSMYGVLTVGEAATLNIPELSQNGVITNYGVIKCGQTGNWGWLWFEGAVLDNLPGGVVDFTSDFVLALPAGTEFINRGTLRKSGGADLSSLRGGNRFQNMGLLDVETGTLELPDGGNSSGRINVVQPAELQLAGGSFVFGPSHTFTGAGLCLLGGTSLHVQGPLGGTVTFRMVYDARLDATLNAPMQWTYGNLAGGFTIGSQGLLTLTSPGSLEGAMTNYGTVVYPGGEYASWRWEAGSRFENKRGALLELQGEAEFYAASQGLVFGNAGIFRKSKGTADASFGGAFTFVNSGDLEVLSGRVLFHGPYQQTAQGSIRLAIAGLAPITQYSRIEFDLQPSLAGRFSAVSREGFMPPFGSQFLVLGYPSLSGNFNSMDLDLGGGLVLSPEFTATSLILTAGLGPPPLTIARLPGLLRISWPQSYSGWSLFSTTNLLNPNWQQVELNGNNPAELPANKPHEFFQLRKQ